MNCKERSEALKADLETYEVYCTPNPLSLQDDKSNSYVLSRVSHLRDRYIEWSIKTGESSYEWSHFATQLAQGLNHSLKAFSVNAEALEHWIDVSLGEERKFVSRAIKSRVKKNCSVHQNFCKVLYKMLLEDCKAGYEMQEGTDGDAVEAWLQWRFPGMDFYSTPNKSFKEACNE
jgi:hypothetical protein